MEIEKQFEQEVFEGCRQLSRKHGYTPTYFLQMVQERGAVRATKDLLATKDPSEGLNTLWHLGKLELSVEAMVLDSRYGSLFTEEERRIARKRLADLGYQFPTRE